MRVGGRVRGEREGNDRGEMEGGWGEMDGGG